jgi:ADP-ribose pyrophosphatase YjhB (NUDIX family)
MKKLTTIYEKDIYPEKTAIKNVEYSDRITVKAIVLDEKNNIALIGNKQNKFLQLPGGGVEKDDYKDLKKCLIRECSEEIGCVINIFDEIGYIDDYRPRDKKHCINYCYVVQVLGQKGDPKYTENEIKIGMHTKWFTMKEAFDVFRQQKKELETGRVTFYNTGFNIVRDLLFLEYAKLTNKIHE